MAKAELADNGPVRGTMVILPYGYALWERMQAEVDARIKEAGARNCYFPLFIPESYLQREAGRVRGLQPRAGRRHARRRQGAGRAHRRAAHQRDRHRRVHRHGCRSYRDLPLLWNAWNNVVRWELRPRLFLRTSEFLWQEGHTAHASYEDAAASRRRSCTRSTATS